MKLLMVVISLGMFAMSPAHAAATNNVDCTKIEQSGAVKAAKKDTPETKNSKEKQTAVRVQ